MGEAEQEPTVPLSEARHRMANVFQLLATLTRLRAQRGGGVEARRQVEWVGDAISVLGLLQHRILNRAGDDFGGLLRDMEPGWRRRAAGRPIEITIEAEAVDIPEHVASALAVVAQELVTNALAHGFPDGRAGRVSVRLARVDAGRAALTVADDGIGYACETVDERRLGLWLVGGLCDQVKGALTVTTDAGVTARLEFPAP
jgi:two-component system, sensor histidine kinase PdtaS